MSPDPKTLADQILLALQTRSRIPEIMETILSEAKGAPDFEGYVQQVTSLVKGSQGEVSDDIRERAIALLQQLLEYHR